MSRILKKLNVEGELSSSSSGKPDLKLVPAAEAVPRRLKIRREKPTKFFARSIMTALMIVTGAVSYHYFKAARKTPPVMTVAKAEEIPPVLKLGVDEQEHVDALELFRSKEYSKAILKFEGLIKKYPKDASLKNNLGLTYLKLGDFKNAQAQFQEALTLDPKDGATYNNLGSLKMAVLNPDKAIFYFYQAILYHPEMVEVHLNLAKALELSGHPMESIPEYQVYLNQPLTSGDPELRKLIEKRIEKLNSFDRSTESNL